VIAGGFFFFFVGFFFPQKTPPHPKKQKKKTPPTPPPPPTKKTPTRPQPKNPPRPPPPPPPPPQKRNPPPPTPPQVFWVFIFVFVFGWRNCLIYISMSHRKEESPFRAKSLARHGKGWRILTNWVPKRVRATGVGGKKKKGCRPMRLKKETYSPTRRRMAIGTAGAPA